MDVNAPGGLLRAFAGLEDPRMNRTKKHNLSDILVLAICAVICGADGWTQVAKFGRCKLNPHISYTVAEQAVEAGRGWLRPVGGREAAWGAKLPLTPPADRRVVGGLTAR